MKRKEQLLAELNQLEKEEREISDKLLLENNIYKEGTCWSTRVFGDNYKLTDSEISHITKVTLEKGNLLFTAEIIQIRIHSKGFALSLYECSYLDIDYFLRRKIHPIPYDKFMQIKSECAAQVENILPILKRVAPKSEVLITVGQESINSQQYRYLEKAGYELIKLDGDVARILSLYDYPFLYGDYYIKTDKSLEIIKSIRESISTYAYSYSGVIAQNERNRLQILDNFLESQKL